jgi:ATP-binding cassette, subfamily B, bacterial
MGAGAGGAWHAAMLAGWSSLLAGLATVYHARRVAWTRDRLEITNEMVEQMVGHRTRAVQEPRKHGGGREDQALERYLARSTRLDLAATALEAVMPRGWLLVGLAGLLPALAAGGATPAMVGVSLGAVLLAYRAFRTLSTGMEQLSAAIIAMRHSAPFLHALGRREQAGVARFALSGAAATHAGEPLLEARGLAFRHPGRPDPALAEVSLSIGRADRIVIEGPSGSGKSTLASLLSGNRTQHSGVLLLDGLDLATLGDAAWRRRVVLVPQFHENHVLTGTFAFNLLMGRAWPPTQLDVDAAEDVCRALGLGPLLDRMPSGMLQVVGETGWQLSHGERSRLYIARAALQDPHLMILDESLAALDPETFRVALRFLHSREGALLVVAHP